MPQSARRTSHHLVALAALFGMCAGTGASAQIRFASHASIISRMPATHADGITRSITQGRGEVVFILPGREEPLEAWRGQLAELSERFEVTAVEWTDADLADPKAIAARMQLRGNQPAHVIGEGDGARVALRLATLYPDRVRSLVLSGTDPRWFARDAAVEAARSGAALPADLDTLLSASRLGRITVPVLTLTGDRDLRWFADNSARGWMRTAREQTIRGVGTQPHLYASIEFNRAVARFLERQRMTAGAP